MSQRAEVIQMAVKSGMRDLNQIRSFYDESGGHWLNDIYIPPKYQSTFGKKVKKP